MRADINLYIQGKLLKPSNLQERARTHTPTHSSNLKNRKTILITNNVLRLKWRTTRSRHGDGERFQRCIQYIFCTRVLVRAGLWTLCIVRPPTIATTCLLVFCPCPHTHANVQYVCAFFRYKPESKRSAAYTCFCMCKTEILENKRVWGEWLNSRRFPLRVPYTVSHECQFCDCHSWLTV
jgi:hypothetical protein